MLETFCLFLISIFAILFGIISIRDTNTAWQMQNRRGTRGGEPARFYRVLSRVGGMLSVIAGTILLLAVLFGDDL